MYTINVLEQTNIEGTRQLLGTTFVSLLDWNIEDGLILARYVLIGVMLCKLPCSSMFSWKYNKCNGHNEKLKDASKI